MADLSGLDVQAEMGKIIAKAWADPAFKAKLTQDPKAALSEMGYEIPASAPELIVVENSPSRFYFLLPEQPPSQEISEEDLDRVAAGFCCSSMGSTCGCPTQSWGCH